jgi:uncharacterized membrane protein
VAQAVEHKLCKGEALGSNLSLTKKNSVVYLVTFLFAFSSYLYIVMAIQVFHIFNKVTCNKNDRLCIIVNYRK